MDYHEDRIGHVFEAFNIEQAMHKDIMAWEDKKSEEAHKRKQQKIEHLEKELEKLKK